MNDVVFVLGLFLVVCVMACLSGWFYGWLITVKLNMDEPMASCLYWLLCCLTLIVTVIEYGALMIGFAV